MPLPVLLFLGWEAAMETVFVEYFRTFVKPGADELVTSIVHMSKGRRHQTYCEQQLQKYFKLEAYGPLRSPTSSLRPFSPLVFVFCALWVLVLPTTIR